MYSPYYRLDTGLAPGRKRAYLLYKAALKDAAAQAKDAEKIVDGPVVATPHPYVLALGVISIQKVCSAYRGQYTVVMALHLWYYSV